MKYYIIAGEASGDLHGSNLIKELIKKDPEAVIRCWGGDMMEAAGATLVKHYKEMAFMGFIEVLRNLSSIKKNIAFCKVDIAEFKPDVVIFIDFSGFNLRIAKWAKQNNFTTNYYISPQIWASREGRINSIKRDIDKMYVILPFEKDFYENKHKYKVDFVGHPLIDAIAHKNCLNKEEFIKANHLDKVKPIIALLPGSRKQEVTMILGIMIKLVSKFPEYQFVIAAAPSLDLSFYEEFTRNFQVKIVQNQTYDLLNNAYAAMVTSGTATLETALFKIPQVVCYKGSWISYQIAKRIITLKYISLVNLIMDREVVKELIQNDLTVSNLEKELREILTGAKRKEQLKAYEELQHKLGGSGASAKTAALIIENA